jgi:hypothetical protein
MARESDSDHVGVDAGATTLCLIRFHRVYIFTTQPWFILNFDAWITFLQELSAVLCNGAHNRFGFETNTVKKPHEEV